jgi:hypothetical protein
MAFPAPARSRSTRPDTPRGISIAALRVPLVVKVVGANLAVVALLIAALGTGRSVLVTAVVVTLLVLAHLAAVLVALRPVRDLEVAAKRVWHGDYGVRVDRSLVPTTEYCVSDPCSTFCLIVSRRTARACRRSRPR